MQNLNFGKPSQLLARGPLVTEVLQLGVGASGNPGAAQSFIGYQ